MFTDDTTTETNNTTSQDDKQFVTNLAGKVRGKKATKAKPVTDTKPKAAKSLKPPKPAAAPKPAKAVKAARPMDAARATKTAAILELLKRKDGATIQAIIDAMEWNKNTVRGWLSVNSRKGDFTITSAKEAGAERVYRIA